MRSESPKGVPWPIKITPEGDKVSRMSGVSSIIEAGQLLLPEEASWLAEFKSELLAFPSSKHDDQVDALSQLLFWNRKRQTFDSGDCMVYGPMYGDDILRGLGARPWNT